MLKLAGYFFPGESVLTPIDPKTFDEQFALDAPPHMGFPTNWKSLPLWPSPPADS